MSSDTILAEKIYAQARQLPVPFQVEALNFIEYLLFKTTQEIEDNDTAWARLSLAAAMHGMEDEDGPEYTLADLREKF
ncbi:MAG: hypothetical protein IPF56_08435 [Chloroflexi bacterium]|jgi:hypothetical protein|nr:hypothetical protein [Chloroflexota bacterium]MBK8935790.1 hypothetical protein [Chloroflexota bacterium]